MKECNCLECHTTFIRKPGSHGKFCTKSCAAIFNNRNRIRVSKSYTCPQCNTQFTKKQKFCSRRCGWNYKKRNHSIEYIRAYGAEKYKRYIARRKYQTPVGEDIQAIREFYRACPEGYEVDHIVPISKGGAHSIDNLQYLTKSDNRKKSNKLNW
jgi:predicted nucleic acid-binding Zn ribbon protein